MGSFDFDVALTFAGEDRNYVRGVADSLRDRGVQVFYDQYDQAKLWGEDLAVYLDEVYRKKSRYVVLFGSAHYVAKVWTSHERRSAQARGIEERGAAYILPVRLDDTEIPGLPPTVGFLDGRVTPPERVAGLLLQKLGNTANAAPVPGQHDLMGVPLTAGALQAVVTQRPAGWEYLLLAGAVWQAVEARGQKLLDFELGYAPSSGRYVAEEEMGTFLSQKLDELKRLVSQITTVISPEAQVWALGAAGEPGDPIRIAHLCDRFGSVYEDVLDWAAQIRGTSCPDEYFTLLSLLAEFARNAIEAIREFAAHLVAECEKIPAHLAIDNPEEELLDLTIVLKIDIDSDVTDRFIAERNRLNP